MKQSSRIPSFLTATTLAGVVTLISLSDVNAGQGPQPSICTRGCWSARSPRCTISQMGGLNRAIVHHTAGTGDYTTSLDGGKSRTRGVQNYHMDNNGWCDIGYHFLVNAGGYIFEGRYSSMGSRPAGAHDGCNSWSMGFNVMGYYHSPYNQNFTTASKNSLEAVIAWKMPSSWSANGSSSYCSKSVGYLDGHYKVFSTACPGSGIIPSIPSIRSGVTSRKNGDSPTNPPDDAERMDLFVRGGATLFHKFWKNGTWSSSWINEEVGMASDPSVVAWGSDRLDVFCQGTDTQLKHKWWNGDQWSTGWENLGTGFVGAPDACSWGEGRIDVFARSSANTLLHKWWNGEVWSTGWEDLGGSVMSDPSAVSYGGNRIDVFARGSDNLLKHIWFTKTSGWFAWETIGTATLVGGPDAASMKKDSLDVFCQSTSGDLLQFYFRGSGWTTGNMGRPTGLTLTSDPGATSYSSDTLYVTIRGSDNQCWRRSWGGSSWTAWSDFLGGTLSGAPDICSWSNTAGER